MRIGFIARGLTKGGVTRSIEDLLEGLNNSYADKHVFKIFTDAKELHNKYPKLEVIHIKKRPKLFWDYIKILFFLKKEKLDVVIYPKNNIPFTHTIFNFKKINIVTDLAYFDKTLNEYKFFDTLYTKVFLKLSCKISDRVLAISSSTKQDIENILKISKDKIKVFYLCVKKDFKKQINLNEVNATLYKYNIKTPFIFYCGSLSPRKNILRTLVAFNNIKNEIPHNFYLSGGNSWKDAEVIKYIKENLSDRAFRIGHTKEKDLINLYSSANLFTYVSLYEGFGLPILEAQACGCPVITSNKTSCPEIVGDHPLKLDPYSINEITEAIQKVLKDEDLRKTLIEKGFQNVKRFTQEKMIDSLMRHILEIVK